jgi:hypothetical protein
MKHLTPVDKAFQDVNRFLKWHWQILAEKDDLMLNYISEPYAEWIGTDEGEVWDIQEVRKLLRESDSGWKLSQIVARQ